MHRLAVADEEDASAFEHELQEQPPPADPPLMPDEVGRHIELAETLVRGKWPKRVVEEAGMNQALLSFFAGSLRASCDLFLKGLAKGHVDPRQVRAMRRHTQVLRRLLQEADLSAPAPKVKPDPCPPEETQ